MLQSSIGGKGFVCAASSGSAFPIRFKAFPMASNFLSTALRRSSSSADIFEMMEQAEKTLRRKRPRLIEFHKEVEITRVILLFAGGGPENI
jgi:hypothetical protein